MKTTTFFGEFVGERSLVARGNTMPGCSCHPRALERRDDPGAMRVRQYGIIPQLDHQRKYPHLYHKPKVDVIQCRIHSRCSLPNGHASDKGPSGGCLVRELTGDSW